MSEIRILNKFIKFETPEQYPNLLDWTFYQQNLKFYQVGLSTMTCMSSVRMQKFDLEALH